MQRDMSKKCKILFYVALTFCGYLIVSNIIQREHLFATLSFIFTLAVAGLLTFGKYKNFSVQKYALGILLEVSLTVYGCESGILAYNQGTFLAIVCLCSLHLDKKLNIVLGGYIIVIYAFSFAFMPQELYSDSEEMRSVIMRLATIFIGQIMILTLIKHIEVQRKVNEAKTLNRITLLRIVEEKRKEALAANNAKSDFLANMSHEIRTPMNAIVGLSEIVMRGNISQEVREHMLCIKNSSRSLVAIINEILDFSKIESGKFEIIPVNYHIASTIYDVATIGMLNAESRPIEFIVDVDKNLPMQMLGDEIRIKQIMLNFVTNATKYTTSGKIHFKVYGKPLEESKILLCISVTDTGIGIKKADIDRLFSSFMQVDTKRNRLVEGTGLGLAIAKRLAELMKGEIFVESDYGVGSVFSASIPQTVTDHTPIGKFTHIRRASAESSHDSIFMAPKARLLVVDDNKVNIMVAKGILARYGMEVHAASSAEECFTLVSQHSYHMILMDHMMPGMDGLEATKHLRARGVTIPIIALTANAIAGAKDMYMTSGFDAYISKPIEVTDLERVLVQFLPPDLVQRSSDPSLQPPLPAGADAATSLAALQAAGSLSSPADARVAGAGSCNAENAHFQREPASVAGVSQHISHKIARTIQSEGRKKLPLLREYWEKKDWHNYAIEVHALKTTARYCGQEELYNLAKGHEDAELSGCVALNESDFARLYSLYEELLCDVAPEAVPSLGRDAREAAKEAARGRSAVGCEVTTVFDPLSTLAVSHGAPFEYVDNPDQQMVLDIFHMLFHCAHARDLDGLKNQVERLSKVRLAYDQEAALWRIIAAMQLADFTVISTESLKVLESLAKK